MGFMDNLAADPKGSGIYNSGAGSQPPDYNGMLSVVNSLRDRELNDFKQKAQFMSDLSLRQNRLAKIYDQDQQQSQPQNVQFKDNNPDPTQVQQAQLGLQADKNQAQVEQGQAKLDAGNQALDLNKQKLGLAQQKSDQINQNKQDDMQRKMDEANAKLGLAYDQLNNKNNNAADALKLHQSILDNTKAYHDLQMKQQQSKYDDLAKVHQALIDKTNNDIQNSKGSTTKTSLNPDGTSKTVQTTKGVQKPNVQVIGKDGQSYMIPADKVDDWNANHTPDASNTSQDDQ